MTERKCFVFRFADVEVREREFLLIKAGERIPVEPKAFRVLLFLLRNPGRLIPKDEIVESVWNDSAVSDNSLTRSIAQLRRVLGDDSREPQYILTVPTVGYRFLCEVSSREDEIGGASEGSSSATGTENAVDPMPGTDGLHDTRTRQQVTMEGVLAFDLHKKERETAGHRLRRSLNLRFAGLAVVAAVLILGAGYLVRRTVIGHRVARNAVAHIVVEQRVTSNPPEDPVRDAVVSPDGKYVAYADPTGTYLRQISGGETRPWSLPKDFVAWPNSWFPDGTHLLVARMEGQAPATSLWKPSLYKLSLLGGEPQKIMDDAAGGSVSPDGSRIAYLPGPKLSSELWIMDADGANSRKVVSAGKLEHSGSVASYIYPVIWSPGAKRLAYIERHVVAGPDPVEPTVALLTIDPKGGEPIAVLNDSRLGPALWWAPDGRILFAYREDPAGKQNNFGVYAIRIDERTGKAAGPPQPLTQAEGGIEGLSATADGKRLVLWRTHIPTEVFITKFDAGTHQFKEPRRLTLDANDNIADAWTVDSKAVLFVSNRDGTWKLFKQGIDETTAEVLAEGPGISLPRLSADGTQVLYLSASRLDDPSFPASLMSRPLAGGPPHLVLQEKGIINFECARAPSKVCIFSNLAGNDLIFRSFDLEHGAGSEVVRIPNGYTNWSISPDGSKLAIFLDQHRIRFLALDTGAASDVTVKDWPLSNGDWSADSKRVYMKSVTPDGLPVILEVDQAGNAEVVLEGSANIGFACMVQSPDGQYGLLLEAIPAENNAWLVDDF
jgi:DNA-binding winged helix-turn-helix (wHTH) protein/Tol biopolymer transport system component